VSLTVRAATERLVQHIGAVVVGKREVTEQLFGALLVEGHVLLDDVPGVGKTTLARAVARSLDLTFRRIQCTPDLVPSDVTGVSIYDQHAGAFEYQVTVDETTHPLPDPFLVIATQNPVELEGTFPLPEAQLDRFLFLLNLGYPSADDEDSILRIHGPANVRAETLDPILSPAEIAALRDEVRDVRVGEAVRRYAVEIVRGTRRIDGVELGASPRAALALYRAAQAHAAIRGRAYVLPDDVKAQAVAVLRHRLFLNADAQMRGRTTTAIIGEVLARTPVPAEEIANTLPAG
jgi:MoxR-like ATPase